ncbi:unnamed protein product [Microthlaspi erraticum]|uniref:Retrotransposon gag domain-containing protein n=1 Tax=Microthlaspi erraticum TaxID=1685480 RepID=A0A6D2J8H0_9BRAS|nr:unnamed protein product [Microthlaspi erraticum]
MADPPGVPEFPLGADQQHGGYPVHPPHPPRQIGAADTPTSHVNRHGITPPPVPFNFEIKTSLISLVESSVFHGMKDEDPLKHLDKFDRICSLQQLNGVSEDGFKLRLFPFSLEDKALTWEASLPAGSVTTWAQCKQSFLAKFFPTSRTAQLRNDISGFTQMHGETFCEAYERFKGYQMQCPHHGFSKENLLSTLYRGTLPKYRMHLDSASNGYFMGKDVDAGLILVENVATSDGSYGEDCDRAERGSLAQEENHKKELKTLNDKLDKLLSGQKKQVHFINGEEIQEKKLNYVDSQDGNQWVYYKHGFSPQDLGSTQAQGSHNSGQEAEMKTILQQIIQGQANGALELNKRMVEIHNKVDCSYNDLNNKFESLTTKVLTLEAKVGGSSSSSTKEYCHAVFSTKDGVAETEENERAIEELYRLLHGTSVEISVNERLLKLKNEMPRRKPQRLLQEKKPSRLSLLFTNQSFHFLREFSLKLKRRVAALLELSTPPDPSHITPTSIPKLEKQGKFTLPCTLGDLKLDDALVDSGASVNLISLAMVKQLGIKSMTPPTSSIMFGDASSKSPLGLIKDYPLKIGDCKVPTDLTVLGMYGDKEGTIDPWNTIPYNCWSLN